QRRLYAAWRHRRASARHSPGGGAQPRPPALARRRGLPRVAHGGARQALRPHPDELLAGFPPPDAPQFEAGLLQEREELLLLTVRGLQAVVDHHARYGPPAAGIAAARRLLALEPWREEVHRQLMVLLARDGQRSAALKQFAACRRVLAAELAT